jgi:hypothetical protein
MPNAKDHRFIVMLSRAWWLARFQDSHTYNRPQGAGEQKGYPKIEAGSAPVDS